MKILNFGSLNLDYVYDVDHFVQPGETMSSLGLFINCGGKGLNQSIAAAKAGNPVYHAGIIGSNGDSLREELVKNGVDVSFLQQVDHPNGHAIIQVDQSGQNCILLYGGTNQLLSKKYIDATLDAFGGEGLVLLQNETNLVGYIIEEAKKRGLQVALNAAPMNEKVLLYPLEKLDWLIVNEVEGSQIAGCAPEDDILPVLQKKYPTCNILLTLGSRGACCAYQGKTYCIPCHPVEVVDTTGAGDTFGGYFLYEMLQGGSVEEALQCASAASALAIGKKGASESVPTRAELEAALREGRLQELPIEER